MVQPVLHEGDAIGRVVFGPFVPEDLVELPTSLTGISADFDAAQASAYLQKIRRVPHRDRREDPEALHGSAST